MRIDAAFKPWLSVSDDANRLSVSGAYLDKDAALLIATDGRMMTRYPVEDIADDDSGIIPVEALKAAAQIGKKSGNAILSVKGGTVTATDGRSWPTIKTTYPCYQQVIPNFTAIRTRTIRLSLNPELLADIYKALGGVRGGVVLEFQVNEDDDAGHSPMLVTMAGLNRPPAVLMPMKLSDRYPQRVDDVEEAHALALAGGEKEFKPKAAA